jgi:hypothetical protein
MLVKYDTKPQFQFVGLQRSTNDDNIADGYVAQCLTYIDEPINNLIISLDMLDSITKQEAACLLEAQQLFYENEASLVYTQVPAQISVLLEQFDYEELIICADNVAEAAEIIRIDEQERQDI